MTNFAHGREAEEAAVNYLESYGYDIINKNWRTRYCEIDVIAHKDDVVYFIEVKYRQNPDQGLGLEYITGKKLKQMQFAARMWLSDDGWDGDYDLAALEVTGLEYEVTEFVTELA